LRAGGLSQRPACRRTFMPAPAGIINLFRRPALVLAPDQK
jgi:hypothetical protein